MPAIRHLERLREIGDLHEGFVTSKEAVEAGIPATALVKMAQRGALEHPARGLYRLPGFPLTNQTQFWEAILWAQAHAGTAAVLSHQSALVLYGISDANPSKVHLTIPAAARLRRTPLSFVALHRSQLDPLDCTRYLGIPVTTIRKTLFDCKRAGIESSLLTQAIEDAGHAELISDNEARYLRDELAREQ